MTTLHRNRTRATLAVALASVALALAGCAATAPAEPAEHGEADHVQISDAWVKTAESGMSAAFGVLENTGEHDVTVVSVESDASPEMQLHTTVTNADGDMVMQEKEGGFVIPAGGTLTLEPGGNHLMLMGVASPIAAGDEVVFTLTFADDSTLEFTALGKDFSGAEESYDEGATDDGMDMDDEGMDMGDMDMGDDSATESDASTT